MAIGSLERFAADFGGELRAGDPAALAGSRIALVGSGPASLIAAHDLAAKGYRATVFEALHEPGGVLIYGIPGFRLPRDVVRGEIAALQKLGVEFRTDFLVGRTCSLDELFEQGYAAVFLGTGAGLPNLMGIPGENLIGVYTANEFLTRLNLMQAYRFPEFDTPVRVGARTVVVGGGNSALDAARWARRMGSRTTILFRGSPVGQTPTLPAAVLLVVTSLVVMVALLAGVTWFEQRVLSPQSIIIHTARCRSARVEHVERLVSLEAERLLVAEDLATRG